MITIAKPKRLKIITRGARFSGSIDEFDSRIDRYSSEFVKIPSITGRIRVIYGLRNNNPKYKMAVGYRDISLEDMDVQNICFMAVSYSGKLNKKIVSEFQKKTCIRLSHASEAFDGYLERLVGVAGFDF